MKQTLARPTKNLSALIYMGVLLGVFALMLVGVIIIARPVVQPDKSAPVSFPSASFSLQILAGEDLESSDTPVVPGAEVGVAGDYLAATDYMVPFAVSASDGKLLPLLEAFDAETSLFTLTTKEFSFGKMITGINGVQAEEASEFWEIVVNGKQAQVGASELVIKAGDEVKLSLKGF